ncbi:MAG: flagellar export protein FliJ [Pseudomonadota bacterium]|nr:flagellar export protein FliJ [Pseudomonadota bacterium]HJO35475.1 flagellar export protein FliJ [Gammaproteobacteria bacterium]
MSARLERLAVVERLRGLRVAEAARTLAIARARLATHRDRLCELEQYRQACIERPQPRPTGIAQLRSVGLFLQHLDSAIVRQRQTLADQQAVCEQAAAQWQARRRQSEAIVQLRERLQRDEARRRQRHEQKASDELATLARRRQA